MHKQKGKTWEQKAVQVDIKSSKAGNKDGRPWKQKKQQKADKRQSRLKQSQAKVANKRAHVRTWSECLKMLADRRDIRLRLLQHSPQITTMKSLCSENKQDGPVAREIVPFWRHAFPFLFRTTHTIWSSDLTNGPTEQLKKFELWGFEITRIEIK